MEGGKKAAEKMGRRGFFEERLPSLPPCDKVYGHSAAHYAVWAGVSRRAALRHLMMGVETKGRGRVRRESRDGNRVAGRFRSNLAIRAGERRMRRGRRGRREERMKLKHAREEIGRLLEQCCGFPLLPA